MPSNSTEVCGSILVQWLGVVNSELGVTSQFSLLYCPYYYYNGHLEDNRARIHNIELRRRLIKCLEIFLEFHSYVVLISISLTCFLNALVNIHHLDIASSITKLTSDQLKNRKVRLHFPELIELSQQFKSLLSHFSD